MQTSIEKIALFNPIYKAGSVAPEARLMQRLDDMIDEDFRTHKDCEHYSRRFGINLRVLNRIALSTLGVTVHEMIQRRTYKEAILLLEESDMSIKRIAYEMGIYDPAYFIRRFKILTGYTPMAYRRCCRDKNTQEF